jgi:hypothetical protein
MAKRTSNEFLAAWMIGFAVVMVVGLIWVIVAESTLAWLVFVGVAAAFLVTGYVRWSRRTASASVPAPAAPIADGAYRMLVVVDDGATSETFRDGLVKSAAGKPMKAFVVAPALSSTLDRWTGDQAAYDNADAQLQATLQALDALGVEATGKIGSHDPLQATIDGLREFPADAIVLATHNSGHANWLEEGLVESIGRVTKVPVSHVVVD